MDRHESQRGYFAYELYKEMEANKDIWLLVGDLGFGVFDAHFRDFPDRCVNVGAAEHTMLCMACGLAMEDKIPFVYSITNFLLYRPFEVLRNYIDHEQLNVKLVASGRDMDYAHDGYSHQSKDAKRILSCLPNIKQYWPESKEEVPDLFRIMIDSINPSFISLKR